MLCSGRDLTGGHGRRRVGCPLAAEVPEIAQHAAECMPLQGCVGLPLILRAVNVLSVCVQRCLQLQRAKHFGG